MPFSIDGFNHKFESNRDYAPDRAIAILTGLAGHVGSKSGVLKLTHPAAPNEPSVFERKSWYQFHERSDANMEETSDLLKDLFSRAIARWPQADQGTFLGAINRYLRKHENRFETGALAGFVRSLNAHPSRAQAAQARVAGRTPQQAMTYLTNLKTQVSEKSGIMVADLDREQKTFAIDNRNWYDPYLEEDAERAASHLRKSFAEALGDQPEVKQAEFLSKIDDYLYSQYHKFGCNKFGTQAFNHFVNQLEELKIGVPAAPLAEPIVQPANRAPDKIDAIRIVEDFFKGEKVKNWKPADARKYLADLKAQLRGESGDLMLAPGSTSENPVLKGKEGPNRGWSTDAAMTSSLLQKIFEKALQDCTESQKKEILKPLKTYLAGQNCWFAVEKFVSYVDQMEKLKIGVPAAQPTRPATGPTAPRLMEDGNIDSRDAVEIVDRFFAEKVKNWKPADARKFLTDLKAQLGGERGDLMLDPGSTSESIVLKGKVEHNPGWSVEALMVSWLLVKAFEKALEDGTESQKNKILEPLGDYLKIQRNWFAIEKFVSCVDQMENLKNGVPAAQSEEQIEPPTKQIEPPTRPAAGPITARLTSDGNIDSNDAIKIVDRFFAEKVKNWKPAEARKFLTDLKAQLGGERGDLMLAPGSTSESLVFKGNGTQPRNVLWKTATFDMSLLLKKIFWKALADGTESQKKEILEPLGAYLPDQNFWFDVEKFVSYVDQMENLKNGVPAAPPEEQIEQPTRPVAGPVTVRLTGDGVINDRDAIKIGEMFVKDQVGNWKPAEARKYLIDLEAKVRNEKGDLMLAPGSTSESLVFEGMEGPYLIHWSDRAFVASWLLQKIFEKAIEDSTESQKENSFKLLKRLGKYLKEKRNWFGAKEFGSYVDQMERLRIGGPAAQPEKQIAQPAMQPTRPVAEPTPRLTGVGNQALRESETREIGNRFIIEKIPNWKPAEARKYLTDVRDQVKEDRGDLMLAPGSTSDSLLIKGVELPQQDMEPLHRSMNLGAYMASRVLLKAFEKALEDCTESQRNEILKPLGNYLTGRWDWFAVKKFISYVDQVEKIKSSPEAEPSNATGVS